MVTLQRALYYLCLAVGEAAPPALLLVLSGGAGLAPMLAVVVAGVAADLALNRWVPVERQRIATAGIGVAGALWAVKVQSGGGYGLLAGWDRAVAALLSFGAAGTFLPYLTLLCAMYVFWRGSSLLEREGGELRQHFSRGLVAMFVMIALGAMIGTLRDAGGRATFLLLTYFGAGLVSIALSNMEDAGGDRAHRLGWRGTGLILASVGAVVLAGLLLASVFGEQSAAALRVLVGILVALAALVLAPLLFLISAIVSWLLHVANFDALARAIQSSPAFNPELFANQNEQLAALPTWLSLTVRIVCGVVPVLLLLALLYFIRRRRRLTAPRDETRESLWSWDDLAADLRGLLAGRRRAGGEDGGLQAALARLKGDAPHLRVRRSYVRALIAGSRRAADRPPGRTPREFAPLLSGELSQAAGAVSALTERYERARYHPPSATTSDAEAAERAADEIERASRARP